MNIGLAMILLALTSTGAAAPVGFVVTKAKAPVMCEINKIPVSCAYLLALFNKIRDEQRHRDRAI